MTQEEIAKHATMAEKLLAKSRRWRASANDPDAAGSAIRDRWRADADRYLAEAQVHASLAAAGRRDS